jgi:hypothetical protein
MPVPPDDPPPSHPDHRAPLNDVATRRRTRPRRIVMIAVATVLLATAASAAVIAVTAGQTKDGNAEVFKFSKSEKAAFADALAKADSELRYRPAPPASAFGPGARQSCSISFNGEGEPRISILVLFPAPADPSIPQRGYLTTYTIAPDGSVVTASGPGNLQDLLAESSPDAQGRFAECAYDEPSRSLGALHFRTRGEDSSAGTATQP